MWSETILKRRKFISDLPKIWAAIGMSSEFPTLELTTTPPSYSPPINKNPILHKFSPKDFGAKADGKTDDTFACNAAATQAQIAGGELVFSPGTYLISGYIIIKNGVRRVSGNGGIIRCSNSTTTDSGVLLAGRASGQLENVKNCRVEGLQIDCSFVRSVNTHAIYGQNVSDCEIVGNRIINLAKGAGILLRSFNAGEDGLSHNIIRANDIFGEKVDRPGFTGISVDAELDRAVSGGGNATEYWRLNHTYVPARFPTLQNLIELNNIVGGYYGIALSAGLKNVIRNNILTHNVRNISVQNGSKENLIENNDCTDSLSSAIHLAYGTSENRIAKNRIITNRAVGEGLLQAYVGSINNLFVANTIQAVSPARPKYHIYAGVHADKNRFLNNQLKGSCARAYIAIESGFNPASTDPVHRNFKLDASTGNFAKEGMANIEIIGNQIDANSSVPAIYLAQISDERGNYPLFNCTISDNLLINSNPSVFLQLVENTRDHLFGIKLENNKFPVGASADKFALPRGRAHFSSIAFNHGLSL